MPDILGPRRAEASARLAGLRTRAERFDRPALKRAGLWVAVPLLIVLLTWHALPLTPSPGLDQGWEAALHMALHDGVTFGNQLIFTYGPLGFLSVPTLWFEDTGTIAVLYTVLVRFALALALFLAARRSYGTVVGAIAALLVAGASGIAPETVPFLVFCVLMIDREMSPRRRLALLAVGGAVAGLELLNKESVGIELTVLAIIMALGVPGRRRDHVAVTLGALLVALLVGWTATGQNWGALGDYALNDARLVTGYAAAMSFDRPGLGWEYTAAWVAFAFGLAGALQMTAGGPTRRRWAILALWVAFCFFEYKEAFVRHDRLHGAIYFVALMGGFLALRWRGGGRAVGLALAVGLIAFALDAQGSSFSEAFDPSADASSAIGQLEEVTSSAQRASIIAAGRRAIQRYYPISAEALNLVRGHTVHVAPYQAEMAWAYELDWRPLPLFQSYLAYTTALDERDADALNSTLAPQRILRNLQPDIDHRVQVFDEGLTTRTILCRYKELTATAVWQVLGLGPNRCGAVVPLGVVHAGWYQKVRVPAPPNEHSFVFVRIGGVQVGGFERLVTLVSKPAERKVFLDGIPHRLVEATAADGLLLSASGQADFTVPFNLATDSSTIAVGEVGHGRGGGRPITFSFFAQSIGAHSP